MKRWIVRPGDGATVREIVARAGEDAGAVAEGRVFVGKRRVVSEREPVRPGDEVRIGPRTQERVGPSPKVEILDASGDLVACIKPAGIPSVPDHAGAAHSLVAAVARAVGAREGELRVTSRLDREVSGVVVFARTPEAEQRLRRARDEGVYARRYVAIASSAERLADAGVWDAPIGRGRDARHRAAFGPEAKPSRTCFRVVARAGGFALLAVAPETGRTHQIRVHVAHAGAPLLGDRDYGGPARVTLATGRVVACARVALHAARVTVPGAGGVPITAEAPVPAELTTAWTSLGGATEAWGIAVGCDL